MPGAGGERGPVPVHLVAVVAVVGAAVRVRAGRDARGRVGGVLLVHRARRTAQPALLRAGRAARCSPRHGCLSVTGLNKYKNACFVNTNNL